jgi:hypothetical protein
MDFNEAPEKNEAANNSKNKITLLALAVVFIAPVLFAYLAYFGGWFQGGSKSKGEVIAEPWHIDDLRVTDSSFGKWVDSPYMGKWNWLLVMDDNQCLEQCQINWFLLQQTHLGLAKNVEKNNFLLVLNDSELELEGEWASIDVMQTEMSGQRILLNKGELRGLNSKPMPANGIYLVDPLGNIFMRYDLITNKQQAPLKSKDLRSDISRVMRVLGVSVKDE